MKGIFSDSEQRENFLKIALSALLFITALILRIFEPTVPSLLPVIFFICAYLICGFEVIKEAAESIFHGELFDENFLMCIASIGAVLLGDFAEGAAVMILFKVGELFEDIASDKSRKNVSALLEIKPDKACVIRDGIEISVLPEEVKKDETVIVRAGEKVPLDGVIVKGSSSFDMSALTGESLPCDLSVGDNVTSGAICKNGVVHIRTSGEYAESTVARILRLVEEATEHKAKSEKFIRRFSKIYTPVVTILAVLVGVGVPLIFGLSWDIWIKRALTFLVVSCPCALVLSVPLSFFAGIGGASRHGILIKGSDTIEALSKVKTAVFDKTGTLTKGTFTVSAVHPEKVSPAELLDIASLAESYSDHLIAKSIIAAHGKHISKERIGNVKELSGMGIIAEIDGKRVCAGNIALMEKEGIKPKECDFVGTIVHISSDGVYMGHIVIGDEIKTESKSAIEKLKSLGIRKTVMLTGDNEAVAEKTAEAIGLDEYRAKLLPDEKADELKKIKSALTDGENVMFVGDGINDAPVIALADVGVAMGALGSDAAVSASDVVLTDDNPEKAAKAIALSRRTMLIVKENIIFSIGVKVAVLALSAFGLTAMWNAVFADVGVMVIAVLNASRAGRD